MMVKPNFQHHYSSLQCHMIFQKSFKYANVRETFIIIIIKIENRCNASYCNDYFFTPDSLMNTKFVQERTTFIWNCNVITL